MQVLLEITKYKFYWNTLLGIAKNSVKALLHSPSSSMNIFEGQQLHCEILSRTNPQNPLHHKFLPSRNDRTKAFSLKFHDVSIREISELKSKISISFSEIKCNQHQENSSN